VVSYIIEKDWFSAGKNGAIIKVGTPGSSVVKKLPKVTKFVGEIVVPGAIWSTN